MAAMGSMTIPGALLGFMVGGPAACVGGGFVRHAAVRVRAQEKDETPGLAGGAIPRGARLPGALDARRTRFLDQSGDGRRGVCPIPSARSSARCSTSRTWARRWTSRCAISLTASLARLPVLHFLGAAAEADGRQLSEILSRLAYVIRERFRFERPGEGGQRPRAPDGDDSDTAPVATMLGLWSSRPGTSRAWLPIRTEKNDCRRDHRAGPGQFLH